MALTSTILLYGHDATLLDTRRWVLESVGFKVATVLTMTTAISALSDSPQLCILCHTLTPGERKTAIAAAANFQPPITTLSFCLIHQTPGESGTCGETLDSFAGAAGLIAAARRLLS